MVSGTFFCAQSFVAILYAASDHAPRFAKNLGQSQRTADRTDDPANQ